MPQQRFEPTIPVSEQAQTVNALDRAATVIGRLLFTTLKSYYPRRNPNFAITVYVHLNEASLAEYGVRLPVNEIKLCATETRVGYT
jgi:hypothetical protein